MPQILRIATDEMGLRTPKKKRVGGNPLSVSGIYRLFSNPFYVGQLVHQSRWYPGRHEPMITLEQFERAQVLLGKAGRARAKQHIFAYTGLIRCGSCGCSVTAEQKMNRYESHYVYYHCTRKKRSVLCSERCIEEQDLEEQIVTFLNAIAIDKQELDRVLAIIEEERSKSRRSDPCCLWR